MGSGVYRPSSAVRLFAWGGGALFVISLVYFLYVLTIRMARLTPSPPPAGRAASLGLDLLLFGIFAAHHSLLARAGAKRWITVHLDASLERSVYVWVSSLLFIATCAWWRDLPGIVWRVDGPFAWALHVVPWFGVALTLAGARILDPLELAGIRQAYGQVSAPVFKLVGPYRWVRHPIYLGWVLIVFGAASMSATRLAFAAISSAYLAVAIPWEEASLVDTFGEQYRGYQRRVRWRMIPFLY